MLHDVCSHSKSHQSYGVLLLQLLHMSLVQPDGPCERTQGNHDLHARPDIIIIHVCNLLHEAMPLDWNTAADVDKHHSYNIWDSDYPMMTTAMPFAIFCSCSETSSHVRQLLQHDLLEGLTQYASRQPSCICGDHSNSFISTFMKQ